MSTEQFINELREQLPASTGEDRRALAMRIITGTVPLRELIPLLTQERVIATRFAWTLGDVVEVSPATIKSVLCELFEMRNQVSFRHFERSLSKFFFYSGIPESIAGEAAECLFKWLQDPNQPVTTKRYAMLALVKLCKRHPDFKGELKLTLNDILDWHSTAFRKQVLRAIEQIDQS